MQTGNLGAMRFTFQGEWKARAYPANSVVRFGNRIYASNRNLTQGDTPGENNGWDLWLESGFYVGQFAFAGFTVEELPQWLPGWYFMNGDYYPNETPQAVQLNAFPDGFKERWGIINNGSATCVPSFFHADGRGYFVRAAGWPLRNPGGVQEDAMQVLYGGTGLPIRDGFVIPPGAFYVDGSWHSGVDLTPGEAKFLYFDNQLVARTAPENRPLNIAMLPVIYLGV